MSETIDLSKLTKPFPVDDIEWRVSRAGHGKGKPYCLVFAYITARAIQNRLDDVCGPDNWRNEEPRIIEINGKSAFVGGISIQINGQWVTKWDVSDPTNIEPAKGGFSGAMKRAGAQWGIGRYLYHLKEEFAETSEEKIDGWNYAKMPKDGGVYYWQTPRLPEWALPDEKGWEVSENDLTALKKAWKEKFMPGTSDREDLRKGFASLVNRAVSKSFPIADHKCWTKHALDKCQKKIDDTTEPGGPDPEIPFGESGTEGDS